MTWKALIRGRVFNMGRRVALFVSTCTTTKVTETCIRHTFICARLVLLPPLSAACDEEKTDRRRAGAGEGNILEKHRIKRTLQSGSGRSRIYVHFMQIRHDLQISAWTSMWCRAPRRDPRVYPKALKWFSSLYQSYWSRKISPLTLLPLTVNDVHVYVYVLRTMNSRRKLRKLCLPSFSNCSFYTMNL